MAEIYNIALALINILVRELNLGCRLNTHTGLNEDLGEVNKLFRSRKKRKSQSIKYLRSYSIRRGTVHAYRDVTTFEVFWRLGHGGGLPLAQHSQQVT